MPRLLLEQHLRLLDEELAAAVPERATGYASLAAASESLRRERLAWMPDARLAALESSFTSLLEQLTQKWYWETVSASATSVAFPTKTLS